MELASNSSFGQEAETTRTETLNVLFVGNSYTGRHNLIEVVKTIAESGNPGLSFHPTMVVYGGRTLSDQWALGTQNGSEPEVQAWTSKTSFMGSSVGRCGFRSS